MKATTQINYNSTFGTSDSASGTSDGSLGSSVVVVVVVPSVVVVVVVGLAVTVKAQTAVLLPFSIDSTVMSALPGATAVTNPLSSTVAIASSLLVKRTALYDAFSGDIVATKLPVAPSSSDKVDLSNVTPVTGICLTVVVVVVVGSTVVVVVVVGATVVVVVVVGATVLVVVVVVGATVVVVVVVLLLVVVVVVGLGSSCCSCRC